MRMVDSKIYTNSNIKDCIDLFAPVKCEEISYQTILMLTLDMKYLMLHLVHILSDDSIVQTSGSEK